jgi:DNA-binding CsgD family transcriptional regulator
MAIGVEIAPSSNFAQMSFPKPSFRQPPPAASPGSAKTRSSGALTSRVGLVLLDASLNPIFYNAEALRIVSYPNKPSRTLDAVSVESIRSLAGARPDPDVPTTTKFVSGRRRYLCRAFGLEPSSRTGSWPTVAITLERESLLRDQIARFQLTGREIEVVQHLAGGLTSKEIAQRMNISLNTVKTFCRLVMIKMGVTTRAGVIGKLVRGEGRP